MPRSKKCAAQRRPHPRSKKSWPIKSASASLKPSAPSCGANCLPVKTKSRPSLIVNDRWGNAVINPEYNAAQLAEALAKLEGFTYAPSEVQWWQHGHSSERDFLYVTTQNLSAEQLQALSDEVGSDQSLLVCCAAFHGLGSGTSGAAKASERWPNLSLKKIPKMVLARCEWGHDDYSLNVANLPMAQPEPASLAAVSTKAQRMTGTTLDLFGDAGGQA
jgi:adenine-specific DNA-methyltransferase